MEATSPGETALPLDGDSIFFAEDQFDEISITALMKIANNLGATITTERKDASILLVNPASPAHPKELDHIAFLSKTYPDLPRPEIYPYNWLSVCAHQGARVDADSLSTQEPYLVNPIPEKMNVPLKVWVSVNVSRKDDETPEEARNKVVWALEAGGAINMAKRAYADVLIVDVNTQFFHTVKAEKDKFGRHWQRLAQRDWVDYCIETHSMVFRTEDDEAQEEDKDEVDSMVEEPIYEKGRGPGRPTGKPRVDYSPRDDDFLCRYLAAFYPNGSWTSRKTFQVLANDNVRFPVIERHSQQSWQERFKKNSTAFKRRIERLKLEGIDRQLKTQSERTKEAEMKAEEARLEAQARLEQEAQAAAEVQKQTAPEASSSHVPAETVISETHAEEESRPSKKRALVESDDEGDAPAPVPKKSKEKGKGKAKAPEPDSLESTNSGLQLDPVFVPLFPESAQTQSNSISQDSLKSNLSNGHAKSDQTMASAPGSGTATGPATQAMLDDFQRVEIVSVAGTQVMTPASPAKRAVHMDEPTIALTSPRQALATLRETEVLSTRSALTDITATVEGAGPSHHVTTPRHRDIKEQARLETPSPSRGGRTSLLREELQRSSARKKTTVELSLSSPASTSSRRHRHSSPDMVYASVSIPPPISRAGAAGPGPSNLSQQPPPRPREITRLTPVELQAKVVSGKAVASNLQVQYRAKITALSEKYHMTPKELLGVWEQVKREAARAGSKGGDIGWRGLEERLITNYGF